MKNLYYLYQGGQAWYVYKVNDVDKDYSIYLTQSSDEGIGTSLSDDTVDAGGDISSVERHPFIEIEPDWDQVKYWQQKSWENSITRCDEAHNQSFC